MNKNNFLSLLILAISIISVYSYGMDTKTIPLNNGLLTTIVGIVSQTGYTTLGFSRHITSTSQKTDTLINLIGYQKNLDNSKGAGPVEIFCPIVFIVVADQYIEELGQYNKKIHREAKEAIRHNKAIYLSAGQGALIYSLDHQPTPERALALIKKLETKIDRKAEIKIQ